MARPALGRAGRTVTGSTKLTAVEADMLKAKHGTVHSGLRAAVNAYLEGQPAVKGHKAPRRAKTTKLVVVPAAVVAGEPPRCRIHRSYKVINRWVDHGQQWTTKQCADCGFELTALDHG